MAFKHRHRRNYWDRLLGPFDERKLDRVLNALIALEHKVILIMASLDETLELVRKANDRTDSLIVLTKGIKAQLDAALAGALTPAQQAKVDEIFKDVTDQAAEVDAAITENTLPA